MPKMPLRRTYLLRTLFFFIGKLQMFQNYRCKLKSLLHITPTSLYHNIVAFHGTRLLIMRPAECKFLSILDHIYV